MGASDELLLPSLPNNLIGFRTFHALVYRVGFRVAGNPYCVLLAMDVSHEVLHSKHI